jgi:hypothetical protein
MLAAHRALYKAATEGNLTAFNAQVAEVQRLFLITYIQATLKYAELMDRATAKGDQDTLLADQVGFVEGYGILGSRVWLDNICHGHGVSVVGKLRVLGFVACLTSRPR